MKIKASISQAKVHVKGQLQPYGLVSQLDQVESCYQAPKEEPRQHSNSSFALLRCICFEF